MMNEWARVQVIMIGMNVMIFNLSDREWVLLSIPREPD